MFRKVMNEMDLSGRRAQEQREEEKRREEDRFRQQQQARVSGAASLTLNAAFIMKCARRK